MNVRLVLVGAVSLDTDEPLMAERAAFLAMELANTPDRRAKRRKHAVQIVKCKVLADLRQALLVPETARKFSS